MRIHTDKVTDVYLAISAAVRALPGVSAVRSDHGSQSREGALELKLTGNSGRRPNSGRWGADSYEHAATWDEWGIVLAAIYAADPDAICGSAKRPVYSGANDFHWQTGERFNGLDVGQLPEDTHTTHMWDYVSMGVRECRKCTAVSYAPLRG